MRSVNNTETEKTDLLSYPSKNIFFFCKYKHENQRSLFGINIFDLLSNPIRRRYHFEVKQNINTSYKLQKIWLKTNLFFEKEQNMIEQRKWGY